MIQLLGKMFNIIKFFKLISQKIEKSQFYNYFFKKILNKSIFFK